MSDPTSPDHPAEPPDAGPPPESFPTSGARTGPDLDGFGTLLVAVGLVGVALWLWGVVRSQFDLGAPTFVFGATEGSSIAERIDLLAVQFLLLVASVIVVAIGVHLRAAQRPDRSPFGPPLGLLSAAVVVALGILVGFGALADDSGDEAFDAAARLEADLATDDRDDDDRDDDDRDDVEGRDELDLDDVLVDDFPIGGPDVDEPVPDETAYTLTVHDDGCGVFRTEREPDLDNLTWVVEDADGFQVLGRNALGETQYRYFAGGRFTVVLEAWGGDRYVPVSNEVAISC